MNQNRFSQFVQKILVVALVLTIALSQVSLAAAQSNTSVVSTYAEIPQRGQLVVPVGSQFVVPAEWDGLVVTIWRGMGDATVDPVVNHSNSIAKDRAARYGGESSDYVTVIWDKTQHPLPGFTTRKSCDTKYGSDSATLVAGTSIGDAGCFEMIEFDQSSFPIIREAASSTPVPTSTALPTSTPTATMTSTPTALAEVTGTPSAAPAAMQPVPTNDPRLMAVYPVTLTERGFFWLAIILLGIGLAFALFRRPVAPTSTTTKKVRKPKSKTTKKSKTTP